jgi:hypothetical protein
MQLRRLALSRERLGLLSITLRSLRIPALLDHQGSKEKRPPLLGKLPRHAIQDLLDEPTIRDHPE